MINISLKQKCVYLIKVIVFIIIFFGLTKIVAFLCKDDANSYARTLFHEFYEQENIDYLVCGASHVSHGLEANIAGEYFEKNVFNTGTPSQKIDGTYAIIRQASELYNIEKVFLELDFSIACSPAFSERTGFTSEYIVSNGIKDYKIKTDFLLNCSKPKYYLNAFLPIGKDKLMTLNPKKIFGKIKSIITGEYFKYTYKDSDSEYAGKGCVLDLDEIPNGGYCNDKKEKPIPVDDISDDWIHTIENIISFCKEKNIELIFFSMPCSDFYLNERANYDEYYSFCYDFVTKQGFKYYDFNLIKPELLSLEDSDFQDDNHLSKKGVYKWTDFFCDFFSTKYLESNGIEKYFYSSYKEKMNAQEDKIFGLYLIPSSNKQTVEIIPVQNHKTINGITYDIYTIIDNEEVPVAQKTENNIITLPSGKNGKIRVVSYINDNKQNDCIQSFVGF
ncbi:MAG: hypothetical protein J5527_01360 [Treponema sp.]|nr:hypothetical protein [Treponema sp.]